MRTLGAVTAILGAIAWAILLPLIGFWWTLAVFLAVAFLAIVAAEIIPSLSDPEDPEQ